ncbi:CMRF35-like molecule 5 isoform X3 [Salmo salar]|uniref:CMRF35-like molecule 5 isoform X3 n=1 Tax=Salmo salar TaxID=8030 RepID=A0ABM3E3L0_SALSA|nr:CMRF35-like molecule 5 isoform X3 [Salmo salar]
MKIFHVVSCCLLSALCVVESVITKATGVVGGQVTIQCSYADKRFGKSNGKYFCSKKCDSYNDILVQTQKNKNYIEKGRYTIHDKRNGDFTVTIKNLVKSDSGTYWCGVDRSIKDSYQEVDLTVTDAPPKPSTVTSKPHVTTTFIPSGDISVGPSQTAGTSVVIIVCVSLAVLVFAVIPLIFYRCWHSNKALDILPRMQWTLGPCPKLTQHALLMTPPSTNQPIRRWNTKHWISTGVSTMSLLLTLNRLCRTN